MTSPLWGKYCDGGHYCSAPKECCTLGCCYHTLPANGVLSLWFLGHWSFWALALGGVLAALCACSLWRRCWAYLRVPAPREDRSEPDSTGSCYAPPHYSRCSSFHRAPPPPYAEVASKPDLYPLVISYTGDTGMKRGGSASYLMVQYFRNYILRPSGSISATSTLDSLSSSFICNAANEANTVIPPPYSCTGSLEGFTFTANSTTGSQMLHSASSLTCNDLQQQNPETTASATPVSAQNSPKKPTKKNNYSPVYVHNKTTSFINNMPHAREEYALKTEQEPPKRTVKKNKISTENSMDSDENNFSELLNLSVCAPSAVNVDMNTITELQQNYSIANSVTVSDISSLANLGSPDSPPRATSPTVEIRELLDKIQQLPIQRSPAPELKHNRFFVKNKSKTLYMPLNQNKPSSSGHKHSGMVFVQNSGFYGKTKGWLSRSAPATPCGNLAPLFPAQRGKPVVPKSHGGSKSKMEDSSALLTEFEVSDDEHNVAL